VLAGAVAGDTVLLSESFDTVSPNDYQVSCDQSAVGANPFVIFRKDCVCKPGKAARHVPAGITDWVTQASGSCQLGGHFWTPNHTNVNRWDDTLCSGDFNKRHGVGSCIRTNAYFGGDPTIGTFQNPGPVSFVANVSMPDESTEGWTGALWTYNYGPAYNVGSSPNNSEIDIEIGSRARYSRNGELLVKSGETEDDVPKWYACASGASTYCSSGWTTLDWFYPYDLTNTGYHANNVRFTVGSKDIDAGPPGGEYSNGRLMSIPMQVNYPDASDGVGDGWDMVGLSQTNVRFDWYPATSNPADPYSTARVEFFLGTASGDQRIVTVTDNGLIFYNEGGPSGTDQNKGDPADKFAVRYRNYDGTGKKWNPSKSTWSTVNAVEFTADTVNDTFKGVCNTEAQYTLGLWFANWSGFLPGSDFTQVPAPGTILTMTVHDVTISSIGEGGGDSGTFGDLNFDDEVDGADLDIMYELLDSCRGDMNLDGMINIQDLLQVISAWGPCP
jgi:hypothetical protein